MLLGCMLAGALCRVLGNAFEQRVCVLWNMFELVVLLGNVFELAVVLVADNAFKLAVALVALLVGNVTLLLAENMFEQGNAFPVIERNIVF